MGKSNFKIGLVFALGFCAIFSFNASAQDTTALVATGDYLNSDSATLQDVIISATRKERLLFQTPYSVDVVKNPMNDLHQPRTTPEALSFTPGVFVQKTNHGGGSPFLRGLTGNQTLIMIDGVRFNNSTFRFGPNQYPNLIDPFTIERIEVLKGSGSVQYGSDAMGGVLHIITKEKSFSANSNWHAAATARITSQDMEYTGRAEAAYTSEKLVVAGGYSYKQFGDLVGGDTTGIQSPSGYKERDWDVKLKALLGKNLEFIVSSQQVVQKEVPLYHRIKLENFEYYLFDPQRMNVSYARLRWNGNTPLLNEVSVTGIYKKSVEGRRYHRNGNANYFQELDEVVTWGATADVDSKFNNWWTANSGIEWYYDQVESSRKRTNASNVFTERGLYPNGAVQQNFSVYSLHHMKWRKILLETGLRYNHIANIFPAELAQLPSMPKQDDIVMRPSSFVGNASLLYNISKQQVVFGSVSNGYRAPGVDDMGTLGLVDFRYELPAYDLEPEKSVHTEVGYRFDNEKFRLSASIFYLHITDLISRVRKGTDSLQGFPVYIKTNDQEAVVKGFELSAGYQLTKSLSLKSFVVLQHGQNLTRNEPMRRIPPVNGLTTLSYQRNKWYAAAEHQWAAKQDRLAQGDKDDNRIPKGGTPGWQVVNMHAGYTAKSFTGRISLQNLLNEDYRTHGSGINGMGRAVTFSIFFSIQ